MFAPKMDQLCAIDAVRRDREPAPAPAEWLSLWPELCEGAVGIRRFRSKDAEPLFEAVRESVKELCAWMVWCHPKYSLDESARFISSSAGDWEEGKSYSFVIFDRGDGSFLGSVGLNAIHVTHRFANLGYWVRTKRTRRGIASLAVRLIARFGFEEIGLQRVEIVVPIENQASLRVAEKAGAKREGLMRRRIMLGGNSHTAAVYSLVKEDVG